MWERVKQVLTRILHAISFMTYRCYQFRILGVNVLVIECEVF